MLGNIKSLKNKLNSGKYNFLCELLHAREIVKLNMEYVNTSYKGQIKDGRFDGTGTYNFSTGTRYEGELKDGAFHGNGTLHFENGSKYLAVWNEGVASEVLKIYFA